MRPIAVAVALLLLAAPAFAAPSLADPSLADLAAQGDATAVGAALDGGAAIDAADAKGNTALMRAAVANQPEIVKLLLARGAAAGTKNLAGSTALDLAKAIGNAEVVALLDAQAAADVSGQINRVVSGIDWAAVGNAAIAAGQAAQASAAAPRAVASPNVRTPARDAAIADLDRYLMGARRQPFPAVKAELLRHGFTMPQAPRITDDRIATCVFVAGPQAPVRQVVVRVDDKTMTVIDHALQP